MTRAQQTALTLRLRERCKRYRLLVGLLAFALFLLLAWAVRWIGDVGPVQLLRFKPAVLTPTSFAFERSSSVQLNMMALLPSQIGAGKQPKDDGRMTVIEVEEQGRLGIRAYASEAGDWTIGAIITDHRQAQGRNKQDSLSADSNTMSACPFTFKMNPQGVMGDMQFGPAVTTVEKLQIQSILFELQMVFAEQATHQWQGAQRDTLGDYEAHYSVSGQWPDKGLIQIRKNILDYKTNALAKTHFSPVAMAARIKIVKDQSDAEIDLASGLVNTVSHAQTTQMLSSNKLIGESSSSFSAHTISRVDAPELPAVWSGLQREIAACSQRQIVARMNAIDPTLSAQSAELDFWRAVDLLTKQAGKSDYAEKKRVDTLLVNYFRLHPGEIAALIDLLDKRGSNALDLQQELAIWNVIALTGNHAAQQALVGAISNAGLSPQTRSTAANHLFNLEYPEASVFDELWKLQQGKAADAFEAGLAKTALFAIGALAGNEFISASLRASVLQQLSGQLSQAESPSDKMAVLMAIGNSRRQELTGDVQNFLADADGAVRTEAYRALSKIGSDGSLELIKNAFLAETDAKVKSGILAAVSDMPASDNVSAFFRSQAQAQSSTGLLVPVAGYLARNAANSDKNIQALNALIERKPSGQVLQEIYRHVSPDTLKGRK
ncbi:MAG: HEAT repeat domain-containing protein [Rhodoferax sp.]